MRRLGIVAAVLGLAGTAVGALETPEAAFRRAREVFGGLRAFRADGTLHPSPPPVNGRREAGARVQAVRLPPGARSKGTQTLRLRGYVSLNGSGFIPRGSSWATMTVSGWTTLEDQDGRTLRGDVRVEDTSTYYLSGNYVSGWARPSAYVNIYQDGRLLGSTRVEGSISVSGWRSGDYLSLSGSGFVDGTLTYQDGTR